MKTFKSLLSDSLKLYFKHFPAVLLLVLPVALPVEWIKNYFFVDPYESFWTTMRRDGLVELLFLSFITPAALLYFHGKMTGEPVPASRLIGHAIRKWPRIIVYNFAKNVGIAAGLILLVIPGILLYGRLFLADTVIALEPRGQNPLTRSLIITKGNLIPILAGAAVIFVLVELPTWLLTFPAYLLIELFQPGAYWLGDTLIDLWVDVTNVLFLVFGLQLYMRITGSKAREPEHAAARSEDSPADARVAQAAPSLEAQVRELKAMGVTFNLPDDVLIGKLTAQFEPQRYEKQPYTLLLDVAGSDLVDEDGSVLRMSDDVLSFDIECVDEPDIYTKMVRRFVQLSRGEVRIDELESDVDFEAGKAWLSFTHEGERHELDVKFEDDWFDVSVFDRLAAIVKKPGKDFVCSMDGQTITMLYCAPETLRKLNLATRGRFRAMADLV